MTTEINRGPLTPEEKAARAKAAEENRIALEPYLKEAKAEVARIKGVQNVEAMDNFMGVREVAAMVYRVAKDLKAKAEGKPMRAKGVGGKRWVDKLTAQFQRAFGFAQAHNIPEDKVQEALSFAVANPVAPKSPKKAEKSEE